MAPKLGLNLGYWGIGPQGDEAVEIVKAAEDAGFDSVWVAESYGSDVVSRPLLARAADDPRSSSARRSCRCRRGRPRRPRWPARRSTRSRAGASSSASARRARRSPRAGTASSTRSPGAARASTSRSSARSSPARGRSSTRASTTSCRSRAAPGQGKALKLNFHPVRNEIPVFVGAIGRKSVEMAAEICDGWIPIFFSRRRVRGDLGRAPRGGLCQGRAHPLRPRDLAVGPGRDRRRPGRGARGGQGRAAALPRRDGQPRRPTSTSTSPTASGSARSPTRSSRCTSTASARRPTTRSPTSSSTRPRWSAPRTRSPSGSRSSPRPGSTA